MFYAYVLKSVGNDYYYKGHCQNLEKRSEQHNSGMTETIRPYIPLKNLFSKPRIENIFNFVPLICLSSWHYNAFTSVHFFMLAWMLKG